MLRSRQSRQLIYETTSGVRFVTLDWGNMTHPFRMKPITSTIPSSVKFLILPTATQLNTTTLHCYNWIVKLNSVVSFGRPVYQSMQIQRKEHWPLAGETFRREKAAMFCWKRHWKPTIEMNAPTSTNQDRNCWEESRNNINCALDLWLMWTILVWVIQVGKLQYGFTVAISCVSFFSSRPLQVYHEFHYCAYTIIGVTSFGHFCNEDSNTPGVYTRVYPYLTWIEDTVWEHKE